MVHPVLDRLGFVIEPEGVKIHWLTDGAYERTGLTPENLHDEPENRRGPSSLPLKPKAWNRLVLSLAGDRVTLKLNDQAIFERTLEPTNQRSFGLFHYADATRARIRNISYQGEWPRSRPEARPHSQVTVVRRPPDSQSAQGSIAPTSTPSALAIFVKVMWVARCSAFSRRLTWLWVRPVASARSTCVKPASVRSSRFLFPTCLAHRSKPGVIGSSVIGNGSATAGCGSRSSSMARIHESYSSWSSARRRFRTNSMNSSKSAGESRLATRRASSRPGQSGPLAPIGLRSTWSCTSASRVRFSRGESIEITLHPFRHPPEIAGRRRTVVLLVKRPQDHDRAVCPRD